MSASLLALTRAVPAAIGRCELTHLARAPIDPERARAQHREYEAALERLGCTLVPIEGAPDLPDSVFVEDTAVVLDEVAVIARPGAVSRRSEVEGVEHALAPYRALARIESPATLDGGDVLRLGRTLHVGRSERTDEAGTRALAEIAGGFGYTVRPVSLTGCLHLKTAVTEVGEGTVLLNPEWVAEDAFAGMERIEVDPREPFAANALRIGPAVLFPAAFPRTRERLEARGIEVRTVDADELAKAEGGLTCCSILVSLG